MRTANTLSPWVGFGVFLLFITVLSILALRLLARRDA
jgi:hypothetical protein